jgi:alpha-galactosidase
VDGTEALYRLSALDLPLGMPAGRTQLPGLDPGRSYRVLPVGLSRLRHHPHPDPTPEWYDGGVVMSGRLLGEVGLIAPFLGADDLVIVHLTETS